MQVSILQLRKQKKSNNYKNKNRMKKVLGLLMVLFIFQGIAQTEEKKVDVIKIKTSALCGECKHRIEEKFNYTKGIVFAELDLESNVLTVKFKTKHITVDQVKQVLSNLGYHADEMERNKEAFNKLPGCCRDKDASCTDK